MLKSYKENTMDKVRSIIVLLNAIIILSISLATVITDRIMPRYLVILLLNITALFINLIGRKEK